MSGNETERITRLESEHEHCEKEREEIKGDMKEIRSDMKDIKRWIEKLSEGQVKAVSEIKEIMYGKLRVHRKEMEEIADQEGRNRVLEGVTEANKHTDSRIDRLKEYIDKKISEMFTRLSIVVGVVGVIVGVVTSVLK